MSLIVLAVMFVEADVPIIMSIANGADTALDTADLALSIIEGNPIDISVDALAMVVPEAIDEQLKGSKVAIKQISNISGETIEEISSKVIKLSDSGLLTKIESDKIIKEIEKGNITDIIVRNEEAGLCEIIKKGGGCRV